MVETDDTHVTEAILDTLSRDGPLHVMELVERIDAHPVTVDQWCYRLHRDDAIRAVGRGVYQCADRRAQPSRAHGDVDHP